MTCHPVPGWNGLLLLLLLQAAGNVRRTQCSRQRTSEFSKDSVASAVVSRIVDAFNAVGGTSDDIQTPSFISLFAARVRVGRPFSSLERQRSEFPGIDRAQTRRCPRVPGRA